MFLSQYWLVATVIHIQSLRRQISVYNFLFFLSFNLLIGWQLSIWNCCKPFFSLQYNCHTLVQLHTHIHLFFAIQRLWSAKKNKNFMTAVNAACQGNLSMYRFGHECRRFASPILGCKGGRYVGLTTVTSSCADCLEILGVSNSWNPKDFFRSVMG